MVKKNKSDRVTEDFVEKTQNFSKPISYQTSETKVEKDGDLVIKFVHYSDPVVPEGEKCHPDYESTVHVIVRRNAIAVSYTVFAKDGSTILETHDPSFLI